MARWFILVFIVLLFLANVYTFTFYGVSVDSTDVGVALLGTIAAFLTRKEK